MNRKATANDLSSLEAVEMDLRRLLVMVERLKREWLKLPEEVKRANPTLAQFFDQTPTKH